MANHQGMSDPLCKLFAYSIIVLCAEVAYAFVHSKSATNYFTIECCFVHSTSKTNDFKIHKMVRQDEGKLKSMYNGN